MAPDGSRNLAVDKGNEGRELPLQATILKEGLNAQCCVRQKYIGRGAIALPQSQMVPSNERIVIGRCSTEVTGGFC